MKCYLANKFVRPQLTLIVLHSDQIHTQETEIWGWETPVKIRIAFCNQTIIDSRMVTAVLKPTFLDRGPWQAPHPPVAPLSFDKI